MTIESSRSIGAKLCPISTSVGNCALYCAGTAAVQAVFAGIFYVVGKQKAATALFVSGAATTLISLALSCVHCCIKCEDQEMQRRRQGSIFP